MIVRRADLTHAEVIARIHNRYIEAPEDEPVVTFTTVHRTAEAVASLMAEGQPHWVAEQDGKVAGFATAAPFRSGPGYVHTLEHTLLLWPEARGAGFGRALMERVESDLAAAGIHSLLAGVSAENKAGVAFHAALGYRVVARIPEVGRKHDRWHDLTLMQKILRSPSA